MPVFVYASLLVCGKDAAQSAYMCQKRPTAVSKKETYYSVRQRRGTERMHT